MKAIVSLCRKNQLFFLCFLAWVILGGLLIVTIGKEHLFLGINQAHNLVLDYFFTGYTYVGDATPFILVLLFLLWKRRFRDFLPGVAILVLMGILVQVVKHRYHSPRPIMYFDHSPIVHTISWVHVHGSNSFPSGHTACAFSLCCFAAMLLPNKKLGAALFLVALLVGYSRIYLAQHFFEDVYIGSILGTVCAILVAWLFAYIRLRQAAPATEPAPALVPEI